MASKDSDRDDDLQLTPQADEKLQEAFSESESQ